MAGRYGREIDLIHDLARPSNPGLRGDGFDYVESKPRT
jgi:hypothetical protein